MNREITASHEQDWIRACKENPQSRVQTSSDFSEAGPFNEMVVMGVLAVRLQGLNRELEWDGEKMKFKNIGANETMQIMIEDGFTIHNGHPTFNKRYTVQRERVRRTDDQAQLPRRLGTAGHAQVINELLINTRRQENETINVCYQLHGRCRNGSFLRIESE